METITNKTIKHNRAALITVVLLCAVLITTTLGLSLAFFNKKSTINGSVKFTSGIVVDVKNLSVLEITDLSQANEVELNLYADRYNDATYTRYQKIISENFSSINAGDKIRVVSPTIQAGEGSDSFYVRAKFIALYEDPETEELVEATEEVLPYINIKSFPQFDSEYWVYNESDGYSYNVNQNVSELTSESDLFTHYYISEENKSEEISLLSDDIDERSLQIATFNFQENLFTAKIYFVLKLEVVQANSTAISELWDI